MYRWDYICGVAQVRGAEYQLQHVINGLGNWVIGNLRNRMFRQLNIGRIRLNLSVPCSILCATR